MRKQGGFRVEAKAFEEALDEYHNWRAATGGGVVTHQELRSRWVRKRRDPKAHQVTLRSNCDFEGFVNHNGKTYPVRIEAKTFTTEKGWSYAEWWADRKHQPQKLELWKRNGGIALVLVRYAVMTPGYGLPSCPTWILTYDQIEAQIRASQRTMSIEELKQQGVLCYGVDWVQTAAEAGILA